MAHITINQYLQQVTLFRGGARSAGSSSLAFGLPGFGVGWVGSRLVSGWGLDGHFPSG